MKARIAAALAPRTSAVVCPEDDESEVTLAWAGDTFEVYHVTDRVYAFNISTRTMLTILRFLIAWQVSCWFGLKPRLYRRVTRGKT